MTTASAFFIQDGEQYIPTGLGVSTWDPNAQLGAVISGLAAQLLERVPATAPMQPARLTLEIFGAVPMVALTPEIRMVRDGKRIQVVELELMAEGRSWVRATMLRIRSDGEPTMFMPLSRPFPDESVERTEGKISEMIRVEGGPLKPGPGVLWVRVKTPMIEGQPLSPFACVAIAADFGQTVCPPVSAKDWTLANLDISVHLSRMPVGEWLLLDGYSDAPGNGIGQTNLKLGDSLGMFGMSHQSLFLERRKST